jgi:hypothetical protein
MSAEPDYTIKKSVTLQRSLAEEIESRTGARGFSRFIADAARHRLALLKATEITDDYQRSHGEFTDEELAEAERAWRGE